MTIETRKSQSGGVRVPRGGIKTVMIYRSKERETARCVVKREEGGKEGRKGWRRKRDEVVVVVVVVVMMYTCRNK